MKEAIRLSIEKMEAGFGGPFGAVIVCNGRIVARGYNNVLSSNDPTAHAEVDAIRKACAALGTTQLADCELYTSCEPCPMCLGAAWWARIGLIVFGNARTDAAAIGFDDAAIYEEICRPLEGRSLPLRRFLAGEARAAFREWEAKDDKVPY